MIVALVVADVAMTKRLQALLDFKTGKPVAHQEPRVLFINGPSEAVYRVCEFPGIVAGDGGTHQSRKLVRKLLHQCRRERIRNDIDVLSHHRPSFL